MYRTVRGALTVRSRRRRKAIAVVLSGTIALALAVVPEASAASKVLQSVTVSLGSDGTITGIASKAITVDAANKTSTSTTRLNPAQWGNSLPIRVQTAYQYGGKSGTNLADLVGKSGHFVVNVTVTNTTVAPATVHYDADGQSHSTYALIGTPITVLANADLGGTNLSQVVTGGSDDGEATTSGVVGTGNNGHTTVQWSAMLAPPRLAPSTTFTLVEDSNKFVMPKIAISAQPGLITEASLTGLLNSAFSSDPSSALSIQKATIDTITTVDTALTAVLGKLGAIRGSLAASAGNLGARTIANLQSSTGDLQQSLALIESQLQDSMVQLRGDSATELGGALGEDNAAVAKTLTDELNRITTKVLGAAPVMAPTTTKVNGCDLPTLSGVAGSTPTAYQLVAMVQSWLGMLSASSQACRADVATAIATAIGDASKGCPVGIVTLECDMATARSTLGAQEAGLTTSFRSTLTAIYRPDYLTNLSRDVTATTQALSGLLDQARQVRSDVADLGGGAAGVDGSLTTISDDLAQLDSAVGTVQSDLGNIDLTGVATTLHSLNVIAQNEKTTLGQLPDLLSELTSLVSNDCGKPATDPTSIADLLTYISGASASCNDSTKTVLQNTLTGVDAYIQAVTSSVHDWTTVAAATDASDSSSVAGLVNGTISHLATLSTDLGAAQTKLGSLDGIVADAATRSNTNNKEKLDSALQQVDDDLLGTIGGGGTTVGLLGSISALYDPAVAAPTQCAAPGSATPAGNSLVIDEFALQCNAGTLVGHVDDAFRSLTDALDSSQSSLTSAITSAGSLSTSTQADLTTLLDGFASGATAGSAAAGTGGGASIEQVRGQLSTETDTGKSQAQAQFEKVASLVTGAFTEATGKLGTANASLARDFESLLTDLNGGSSANGTGGVVGVLDSNASTAGSQADQLAAQASATSAFNSIQGVGLDAINQQQAEMAAALKLAQDTKPFAVHLSDSSSVLTVYAFTIGGK